MLWMVLTLMTVLAAVGLAIPLIRRRDAARAGRADTVTVLNLGRVLVEGTPSEAFARQEVVEAYLGQHWAPPASEAEPSQA